MLAPVLPSVTSFLDAIAPRCRGLLSDGAIFSPSRGTGVVLEDADELAVATRNFVHRLLSRDLVCPPAYERIPKASTAYREADEPRNLRCYCQPLVYFLVVLAAPKDDT